MLAEPGDEEAVARYFARLSRLGAAARIARQTPEQRTAQARAASLKRWRGAGVGSASSEPTDDPPSVADEILSRIIRPYLARPQIAPRFARACQVARKAGVPLGTLTELVRRWPDQPEPLRAALEREPERLLVASVPLLVAILRSYDD